MHPTTFSWVVEIQMVWGHTNPRAEMSRKVTAGHPTVPGHPGPTCSRWAGGHSLGTVGYQVEPAGDKKWFLPSTTSFLLPQGGQARARSSGKLPNVGSRRAKVGQEISEQTCEAAKTTWSRIAPSVAGGRQ